MNPSNPSTQSSLSRAWTWSIQYSPLLNAYRLLAGRRYSKANHRDLLTAANLPKNLHTLIDTTVKKTKLWKSERADIARELIAHTQDALDANRTEQHIIESFGDPKKTAKLLRRATKRKRPLYWRTLRNIRRTIAALTLLLFITYTGLAARFFTGQPNITKNYAVMINAQNDAYSEDQKAWPIYKEVESAWVLHIADAQQRQTDNASELNGGQNDWSAGLSNYPQIPTDHRDYAETVQLFKSFEPQLKRLRQATHRPIVGIELGFINDQDYKNPLPPSTNPEENPSLINLGLPHLGQMKRSAKILAFDTLIAAREQDSDRTYQNLSAMLALTRQKTFDHTLLTGLVNNAITNLTTNIITQVIQEHPTLLTRNHLVALSHELALTRPSLQLSVEGELMMFDDFLQRAYTDNGKGNGRITSKGLFMLLDPEQENWGDPSQIPANTANLLAGPATLAIVPNRKSQATLYHSMMATYKHILKEGPHTIALIDNQEQIIDNNSPIPDFSPVTFLLPALGRSLDRSFMVQMTTQATTTLLAIELYKRDTGHLPDTLSQLSPNYLPTLPQDLFNPGQPLKYKITDTGYLLYSVAGDGDDDNGKAVDDKRHWVYFSKRYPPLKDQQGNIILDNTGNPKLAPPSRAKDGDWILINITTPHN